MTPSISRRTSRHDTVQLPSGTTLEYTLVPPPSHESFSEITKLAICLHPWSWLGGRMNDPVLQLLTEPLLENKYVVLRYNSRGVGKSTGWPSFTGNREAEDLKELVQWARSTMLQISSLVLSGYSHGSLIASLHPILQDLQTSHILLSYPIGPRHWLTAFHGHQYQSALHSLISHPRSRVLVIYGDNDNFTSAEAYDTWAASLPSATKKNAAGQSEQNEISSGGNLQVVKVKGASHFWREDGVDDRLVDVVREWLP